ncbi:ABC transporter substrate-binding protein [Streptomyces sp. NPDC054933]
MRPAFASHRPSDGPRLAAVAAVCALVLAATGCAPQQDSTAASGASGSAAANCAPGALRTHTAGKLTIGTDKPAYAPWFQDDNPADGKGFEAATAYAVAKRLGYDSSQVVWQTVPFNNAITPGAKNFDLDLNQVSISDERRRAVDFSSGYYDVRQALIALKGSKIANAKTLADLRGAKLGAQVGTTSLDVLTHVVKPTQQPAIYQKNDLAKSALKNGQVDGIVVDLPTAFYITSAEVTDAKVVGQFVDTGGQPEQFGFVLDKGSPLTPCVSKAVDALRANGTLAALDKRWLSEAVNAPVLK